MNYMTILFLFVICTNYLKGYVSALNAEGILYGQITNTTVFPYQAAILGRSEDDLVYKLLCAGAIVSEFWILSVAHCFMLTSEVIKQLAFMAVVGSQSLAGLTPSNDLMTKIMYIYTYHYIAENNNNDITMAKTGKALTMGNTVKAIGIARSEGSLIGKIGLISGYGSYDIINDRLQATDLKLRNTTVVVYSTNICFMNYVKSQLSDKFCGVSAYIQYKPDYTDMSIEALLERKSTGVCDDDNGSPLVIDGEIIGISCLSNPECRDSARGSLYVDARRHFQFIENVKKGNIKWFYRLHPVNANFVHE